MGTTEQRLDAIVCGVGSGGTITGLSRYFARTAPNVELVLADPLGSALASYVQTGTLGTSGSYLVEGIGQDQVPPICDLSRTKRAYTISDSEAFATTRELLQAEGILGGTSTGTLLAAALRYCREQSQPKRVVTFVCDTGNKYLSKAFNDAWLTDHGLMLTQATGDLRDFIGRRYERGEVLSVSRGHPCFRPFAYAAGRRFAAARARRL